jgi:uncharacterized delta-60 repeat protein
LDFDPGWGADDIVRAIAVQPDAKVLVGGSFQVFDGTLCDGLVRLHPDGRRDPMFNTVSDGIFNVLVALPDGKLLVAGSFTSIDGTRRQNVARLNSDGSLDPAFGASTGVNDSIWTMAIQPDERVVIGGYFAEFAGVPRAAVARLLPDGRLDESFDPGEGPDGYVNAVALQADGKVLVGGYFSRFGAQPQPGLARLHPDGRLDVDFEVLLQGQNVSVNALAVQPDGRVLVGGRFSLVNGRRRLGLARLTTNGSLDPGFAGPGLGEEHEWVGAIAFLPQGRIVVAGDFAAVHGIARHRVAVLDGDGAVDADFNPSDGANSGVGALAVQPDGNVLLGGDFSRVNDVRRWGIARLWTRPLSAEPSCLEIQRDGVFVKLRAPGTAGRRCFLQTSLDLVRWSEWVSQECPGGAVEVRFEPPLGALRRFYRTRQSN